MHRGGCRHAPSDNRVALVSDVRDYVGLKERMTDDGLIDAVAFEADLARLDDPEFAAVSPTMWSVWGRLP